MKKLITVTKETNNFDFLRLLAAFFVFIGHAILINRGAGIINWNSGLLISALGVNIFFFISGFLITKSWIDSNNTIFFIIKRFLRIYPALIFSGIITIFIIGPITTFFTVNHYLSDPQTYKYFTNITLLNLANIKTAVLPGVFVTNKIPSIVNASLWTIPIEIGCYLSIILMGLGKFFHKKSIFLYISFFFLLYAVISHTGSRPYLFFQDTDNFPYSDIVRLSTYFILGITAYLYRSAISISNIQFFTLLITSLYFINTSYFTLTSYLILPLLVLYIATIKSNILKKITGYGDFSYGFYLFAFPIQQTVSFFLNNKINIILQIIFSFLITTILAIISWYIIEKRFIDLKYYFFKYYSKKISCKKTG